MNAQINVIREKLVEQISPEPIANHYAAIKNDSFSKKIDHTNLQPQATEDDIKKLCDEAIQHHFYSICVAPCYLEIAAKTLASSSVKPITVIGFPHGNHTTETKVFETLDSIDWGAQEVDMVMNIGKLKSKLYDEVFRDIFAVVLQAEAIPVKVIIETSLLSHEEKMCAAILAQMAGASFVKTSTGFGSSCATIDDVRLLKVIAGDSMGVKASGGIKTFEFAMSLIEAGADRIGTSSSVSIMKDQNDKNGK